jgi:hypothetical protein
MSNGGHGPAPWPVWAVVTLLVAIISASAIIIAALLSKSSPPSPSPMAPEGGVTRPTVTAPQVVQATSTPRPPAPASAPPTAGVACGPGKEEAPHPPVRGQVWTLGTPDKWVTAHIWSNHREPNLREFKVILRPGQTHSLMSGGGSWWTYECEAEARAEYNRDSYPELNLQAYERYINEGVRP